MSNDNVNVDDKTLNIQQRHDYCHLGQKTVLHVKAVEFNFEVICELKFNAIYTGRTKYLPKVTDENIKKCFIQCYLNVIVYVVLV